MPTYYADLKNERVVIPDPIRLIMELGYKKMPPGDRSTASLALYMLWKMQLEKDHYGLSLKSSSKLLNWMTAPANLSGSPALPHMAVAATLTLPHLSAYTDLDNYHNRVWLLGWFYFHLVRKDFNNYLPEWLRRQYIAPGSFKEVPLCMEAIWQYRKGRQKVHPLDTPEQRKKYTSVCRHQQKTLFPSHIFDRTQLQNPRSAKTKETPLSKNNIVDLKSGGVNIIGWINAMSGIGEDARTVALALDEVDVNYELVDASPKLPHYGCDIEKKMPAANHPHYTASIVCLAAQDAYRLRYRTPPHWWENAFNIGLCPWELPKWPERAKLALEHFDEVWAPSSFVAHAFKDQGVPVHYVPHVIPPLVVKENLREELAIGENSKVFLTIIDSASSIARKNPHAAIKSFNLAFADGDEDVILILKTINSHLFPKRWAELQAMDKTGGRIIFIDETFTRKRLDALLNTCDAFISLHRSEGFGRLLADAMTLGKVLICSNFGGVTDYAREDTALLVEGQPIPLAPDAYLFAEGQFWFEADVKHAALQMRECLFPTEQTATLAERGKRYMIENHSPQAVGSIIRYRLEQLSIV